MVNIMNLAVMNAEKENTNVEEMTNEQLMQQLADVQAKLASLTANKKVAKNKGDQKADGSKRYKLLSKTLESWGKVPQQQSDLARLLASKMEVGTEYTEQEVFDMIIDGAGEYHSLCTSKQHPVYVFKYYRGLKKDGKHGGFVARNFIRSYSV